MSELWEMILDLLDPLANNDEVNALAEEVERMESERDEAVRECVRLTREGNEKICRLLNQCGQSEPAVHLLASRVTGKALDKGETA